MKNDDNFRGQSGQAISAHVANRLLDAIAMPMFLLNKHRQVIHSNAAGRQQLSSANCVFVKAGRFHIAGDVCRALLFNATVSAIVESDAHQPHTMTLGETSDDAVSATITRFSVEGLAEPLAAVTLSAPQPAEPETTSRIQQSLGLTLSEARIAAFISAGCKPKAIAGHLGVSINTVKSHLARVFAKTGCSDQAAFCAFAARILTPVAITSPSPSPQQRTHPHHGALARAAVSL